MRRGFDAGGTAVGARRPVRPLRPQLVAEVIQKLRLRLTSGEFRVGDRLPPEAALAADLGVGRTTLREAVRVLEHDGLVDVRHGSGSYVRSLSGAGAFSTRLRQGRVLEVLEVRRALEIEMTRLTAARRSEGVLLAMTRALEQMRQSAEAQDERSFLDADMEMCRLLAVGTGNAILMELHGSFAEALRLALAQVLAIPGVMLNCLSRHGQLYEAILARDEDLAVAVAKSHLERLTRLVEDLLGAAWISEADRACTTPSEQAGAAG